MLKAQLAQDFFDVSLAADRTEFFGSLRRRTPDVVLLSYSAERKAEFANLQKLRESAKHAHLPVIFLTSGDDPRIWDQSHDCLADDVLPYTSDRWLLNIRLNLLTRSKEKIDALFARQRTISDMGFSEDAPKFPPPIAQGVVLDFSHAHRSFDSGFLLDLKNLLRHDFPMLELRTRKENANDRPADISLIDAKTQSRDAAFAALCALRKEPSCDTQAIYIDHQRSTRSSHRAIELGAQDFTLGLPSVPELACRLRRLLWLRHMQILAERSVSNHLRSALTDPLTGLYNRRYAFQYLARLLGPNSEAKSNVTVMVLDLDRFKSINDTHGHLVGDAVIRETALRLRENLRAADLVARIGGEEFLVVLTDTNLPTVRDIAERLRSEIARRPFTPEKDTSLNVSASIGVSASQKSWNSPAALVGNADAALYQAKGTGRNRVTFGKQAA